MTRKDRDYPIVNDLEQFCAHCNLPIKQHNSQTAIKCAHLILEGVENDSTK